ncbi:MAG: hypothetical protein DMG10_28220 [Acidobacteria bacterium]|nr:MAG: hypothetical protein DMG10_28220 [Acidobacteriota bacterium]
MTGLASILLPDFIDLVVHLADEGLRLLRVLGPVALRTRFRAISSGLGCRMNSAISALRLRKNPDFAGRPSVLARKSALSLTGRATT